MILMIFVLAIIVSSLLFAFMINQGKSRRKVVIISGITTMLVITPLLSWSVSTLFATKVGDGFAGVALMMILLPILFLVGLTILLLGIFKKSKDEFAK